MIRRNFILFATQESAVRRVLSAEHRSPQSIPFATQESAIGRVQSAKNRLRQSGLI